MRSVLDLTTRVSATGVKARPAPVSTSPEYIEVQALLESRLDSGA